MNTQDDNINADELEEDETEENPNEGVLEGMACPKCGSFGPFDIEVMRWVTVEDCGDTDDEGGDTEWEEANPCRCNDCGHGATVADFSEDPIPAKPTAQELLSDFDALARHIVAMADDAYLVGHPEWAEIVKEAKACIKKGQR